MATIAACLALMLSAASTHVYELRTYHANPGKLADLEARFRDHTIAIFNKHHMKSVAYWVPTDNKDNVLIYVLEHESQEEAMKNWKEFQADPEWQAVAKASEVNGKLVDHVDRVFMSPTDFSPMK
jgi:cation transport regulator ChaC